MFSIGQKVVCVNASGQPTLQENKTYTIWALQADRGIRVTSDNGNIRHSFSVDRFVPAAAPVSELVGMPDTFSSSYGEGESVLVVGGIAYNVDVIWNAAIGRWTLSGVTRLTAN